MTGLFQGRKEATLVELLVHGKPVINSGCSFTDHSEATALQAGLWKVLEGPHPDTPQPQGHFSRQKPSHLQSESPIPLWPRTLLTFPGNLLCRGPSLRASLFQFNDLASLSLTLLDKGGCVWAFPPVLGLVAIRAAPGAGTLGSSPLGAQSKGPAPPAGLRLVLLPGSLHTRPLSAGPRTGLVPGQGLAG